MRNALYLLLAVVGLGLVFGIVRYGQTPSPPPTEVASAPAAAPAPSAPSPPELPPAGAFAPTPAISITTLPGMPPVSDGSNLYSETTAGKLSPATMGALERIYVPHVRAGEVYVIDPAKMEVVDRYKIAPNTQHVIPSWDLKTLWVAGSAEGNASGSLTAIDPTTGKLGEKIQVRDAYNMYFTPDGQSAIVVAELLQQLDFRDAHTMKLQKTIGTPNCPG